MAPEEKSIHSVLGGEILKRVESVSDIILRGKEESSKKKAEKLGIKELESYTKEESNLGIKKYVAVIKEYQKKYRSEVEVPTTSSATSYVSTLKGFLGAEKIKKEMSKEENLLYYWVYEMIGMSPTVKKDELDSII